MSIIVICILILLLFLIIFNFRNLELFTIPRSEKVPKKIWTFWHTDEILASNIIKLSYKSIRKICPEYEFIQINFTNLKDYVKDIDVIDILESDLEINYKSDLLRMYLMYNYGGIYLDSSIFVLQSFDWIYDICKNHSADMIICKNIHHSNNIDKPVLESWFIASKPKQDFNKMVLNMLIFILKSKNREKEFNKILQDNSVDYQNFKNYHGIYHLIYFIFIYIQYKQKTNTKIYFYDFNDHEFMFIYRHDELMKFKQLYNIPIEEETFIRMLNNRFIKLTNYARNFVKNEKIVHNSFMDRYIKYLN